MKIGPYSRSDQTKANQTKWYTTKASSSCQSQPKQDQTSNRYDNILQWLQTENRLMTQTHSHTPNLEMLSHLKKK